MKARRSSGGAVGCRRGAAAAPALILAAALGVCGVAAVVVGPVYLHAGTGGASGPELIAARHTANQEVIERLSRLIAGSAEVVAVRDRGETPYAEVVLLLDAVEGEHVRPSQIMLLSHSAVLQTITLHAMEKPEEAPWQDQPFGLFTRSYLASPEFGERWRTDPRVGPRILAAGISDMTVEAIQPARQSSSAARPDRLRLSLTWSLDSVDGEDRASVLLSAVRAKGTVLE